MRASPCATAPFQRLFTILGAILISVALATVSFSMLLMPWPTQAVASATVNASASPASHDELVRIACQTLAYCNGDDNADLPLGSDDRVAFTTEVIGHLDDVRAFFSGVKTAAVLSVAGLVLCLLLAYRFTCKVSAPKGFRPSASFRLLLSRVLIAGCAILAAVALVIACAAVVDFYALFNLLHSLFFSSGSWLFPYDSLLICALPEPYWQSMGVLWGVFALALMLISLIAAILLRRRATEGVLGRG